jgi:glycosyltransferase involved in cell wall biosynthesis
MKNSNQITALHLSHTDIRTDSRILKEMIAISECLSLKVMGIGLELDEGVPSSSKISDIAVITMRLWSRRIKYLPRMIRHILVFIELNLRICYLAARIKPAIVHCHDTPVLLIGCLLKKFYGSRLIYDAHELESNKNGQNQILSRATYFIEKVSWSYVDVLISVSPSIIDWYNEEFGSIKSQLIMNSPTIKEINGCASVKNIGESTLRSKFSIPADQLIFIYLGLFAPGRGIEVYLDVFARNKSNADIVFIGYGAYDELIKSYVNRYPNIHLHPPVSHDEVVGLVSGADFGLCLIENISLSDYFSLPNKLFEYTFSGCPVISSNFPDMLDLVQSYSLGTCCEPVSSALEDTVNRLCKERPRFTSKDLKPLSWQHQASLLRDVYTELMKPKFTS